MRRPALLLAVLFACTLSAAPPKLIPPELLFRAPAKSWPSLSPDGAQLAYLAPDENGIANVWVESASGKATLLTHEPRSIAEYFWSGDGSRLLYTADNGDEDTHVFSIDLASGNIRDLTPFRGVRTQRVVVDRNHPREILVDLNLRDRRVFDVHRVNLDTGALSLEAANPGDVNSWVTDRNFVTRAATAFDPASGNTIIRVRNDAGSPWRDLVVMPFERTPLMGQIAGGSMIAGFTPDGQSLYIASALHSDTARIERIDLTTGRTLEVIAEHPKADAGDAMPDVMLDPATGAIQAVKFDYLDFEWRFIDARVKADLESIAKQTGRFVNVISRSNDDSRWIVSAETASAPNRYYTYDRATKKLDLLFDEGEHLAGYTLAPMKAFTIKARDGMELVSYLTLPPGSSGRNLPTIIFPHGGPWARDWIGWYPDVQFFANRGFAVLQVNHRGSTGLGLAYLNAGNGRIGTGTVDDYVDAARWAVANGIADPNRLILYGQSMGGYDTVRLLTRDPDMFAGGIAAFTGADLRAAINAFPPYWVAARARWIRRIGDVIHDEALNRSLSPIYDVARMKAPLLIVAGAHDVRARQENVEKLVNAMREAKRDVDYHLYDDEGHGFAKPANQIDFFARVDQFLAKHVQKPGQAGLPVLHSEVLQELVEFLRIPNVATNLADMDRNAAALEAMMRKRGIDVNVLRIAGAPPLIVGDLAGKNAKRTIAFYAHYDGQPVNPKEWSTPPFEPTLKGDRLYARSASDDKAPIIAMLAALDSLQAAHKTPSINIRFVFDGEEERGSPHLEEYFRLHPNELAADAWIIGDGPVHPSRKMQIFFGARGIVDAELTTYGPARPLHSGNYGNWGVNPIVSLTRLLATMRDESARILIPGFYDDIRALTPLERDALANIPPTDDDLRRELALGRTEGEHQLAEQVLAPALNLRGISGGHVGDEATNSIPSEATASIDFRLVPDQTPESVQRRVEAHIESQGFFIVRDTPDAATRLAHPKIMKIVWGSGYPPARTRLDLPISKQVRSIIAQARGEDPVLIPSLGGSVPMYLFARGGTPVIGVPIVNHDNRQHSFDENLRLQNLWDGIEVYAALFAAL